MNIFENSNKKIYNKQLTIKISDFMNINTILSSNYEEYNYILSDYSFNSDEDFSESDKNELEINLNSDNYNKDTIKNNFRDTYNHNDKQTNINNQINCMKEEQTNNLLIENSKLINDEKKKNQIMLLLLSMEKTFVLKKKELLIKKNINRILYKCINNRHN